RDGADVLPSEDEARKRDPHFRSNQATVHGPRRLLDSEGGDRLLAEQGGLSFSPVRHGRGEEREGQTVLDEGRQQEAQPRDARDDPELAPVTVPQGDDDGERGRSEESRGRASQKGRLDVDSSPDRVAAEVGKCRGGTQGDAEMREGLQLERAWVCRALEEQERTRGVRQVVPCEEQRP